MPFDKNLILRGKYGLSLAVADYVDLDSSDTAATSLASAITGSGNTLGNSVVDLGPHGTGAAGMDCIIIQHDQATTYTAYADYVIEDSDHIAAGFQSLLTFPRIYTYMIEIVVVAVTAFVASDIDKVLNASGSSDVGILRAFSRKLLVVGGVGKMFVEMQSSGDLYDTDGDTVDANSGTGDGTQIGVGRIPNWVSGLTIVRRFSTPKRYIRLGADAPNSGNFKSVDVLVTGSQHGHVNNLYR